MCDTFLPAALNLRLFAQGFEPRDSTLWRTTSCCPDARIRLDALLVAS